MVEKKQSDYTKTAVNLCNPPEIKTLLTDLSKLKHLEAAQEAELRKTQLYAELAGNKDHITALEHAIRTAINAHGSYQDLGTGDYAIKQRRLSITYIPGRIREFLRDYADAVIEEVVNKKKLEGLHKGGLVSQGDLDRCGESTESFAFIIKAGLFGPEQGKPKPEGGR